MSNMEKSNDNPDVDITPQDCVIFMTAYNTDMRKKKLQMLSKKEAIRGLLISHRISSISSNGYTITRKGKLKYSTAFNTHKQSTEFKFDVCEKNEKIEDYQDEIKKMSWLFSLSHSLELLVEMDLLKLSLSYNMEKFLVSVNSRFFQVDSIAFVLNGIVFVSFELIDYSTGVPLKKEEIYGRNNNYNIVPVDGIQYFDENEISEETRSIPDIIFENVQSFIGKMTHNKFHLDSYSYVHNILVLTDNVSDLQNYYLDVLQAKGIVFDFNNINTNDSFEYYSKDFMGVAITGIDENRQEALFNGQMLEVYKMYIYIKQIVAYDVTNTLTETINRQAEIDLAMFTHGAPIITINAIDNIKKTESFKKRKDAIEFKISYLGLLQEKKKNRNALLLNILLFVLSFIGGISALQVFQDEFGWSFKISAIILTILFSGFGIYWVWKERKE